MNLLSKSLFGVVLVAALAVSYSNGQLWNIFSRTTTTQRPTQAPLPTTAKPTKSSDNTDLEDRGYGHGGGYGSSGLDSFGVLGGLSFMTFLAALLFSLANNATGRSLNDGLLGFDPMFMGRDIENLNMNQVISSLTSKLPFIQSLVGGNGGEDALANIISKIT